MHIEERKVTVREVTERYFNDAEEDVVGYDYTAKRPGDNVPSFQLRQCRYRQGWRCRYRR